MVNIRREKNRKEAGFDTERERKRQIEYKEKALKEVEKEEARQKRIEQSSLYQILINGAIGFDIADGVLGFLEWGGDTLSFILSFLYIVVSASVVRSFRLTMAVLSVVLVDFLIGMIPGIGSVIDFIFCGNYINRTLIKGFVENNKTIKQRVNWIASICLFIIVGFGYLIYSLATK